MKKSAVLNAIDKLWVFGPALKISSALALSVWLTGCANPQPSIQDDVWCADTAIAPRATEFFDATVRFKEGGVESAIAYAETRLGALFVPSNEIGTASRSGESRRNAALRGCDVLIILETLVESGEFGRGRPTYNVLLARKQETR